MGNISSPSASALALAQGLIRCPSVTPAQAGALDYLDEVLRPAGFITERPVFHEEGTPDVENLYARIGTSSPVLAFAGHTDVVPPGDITAWSAPPFAAMIRDGRLYGRGATDMKGGIAAFIAAVLNYVAQGRLAHGSIVFLITGDEEGPSVNGTVKLLDWATKRGERFDHCIVGEPTSSERVGDTIKIGRRGSYSANLTVRGRQGHVAYPHLADNPLPRLMALLAELASPLDHGTRWFDASNLEIVGVEAGTGAFNVIPETARAKLNVRFNDLWTLERLESEIRRRLDPVAGPAAYALEAVRGNSQAFRTEPGAFLDHVAQAVAAMTGKTPAYSTSGGTSDARFIKDYCPVIELGLVGKTMHQIDEHVIVDELAQLQAIYGAVIAAYFDISGRA
ncbi:MAG: succinyl-diaminopimelate desuccinylase [Hyphomicrobiales bacterium]|nr:succinyl-diaminopimelate desuccinylase [Hyphomicrobiales bacterium]OQW84641.1 MAG: succinyl-diaminopimelate desuccinylase [Proteobacteria bacterium ST_bin15]